MAIDWGYYDKFEKLIDKYMPMSGEGETKASQIVTAVNKLIYKYYNDGDVFDNTHYLEGWANDLSSYANWLYENTKNAWKILNKIYDCSTNEDYEDLLKELADELLNEEYLAEQIANQITEDEIEDCIDLIRSRMCNTYGEDED